MSFSKAEQDELLKGCRYHGKPALQEAHLEAIEQGRSLIGNPFESSGAITAP